MQDFCYLEDVCFYLTVSKNTKHRFTWSQVIPVYTISVSDMDIGATSLQLYVCGCHSDTMVMSLHPDDASVGCLRS